MVKKTKIAGWKIPIIRWSMRQIAPFLEVLPVLTFEGLARLGIEDVTNVGGDVFILPSAEKYIPEPLD